MPTQSSYSTSNSVHSVTVKAKTERQRWVAHLLYARYIIGSLMHHIKSVTLPESPMVNVNWNGCLESSLSITSQDH